MTTNHGNSAQTAAVSATESSALKWHLFRIDAADQDGCRVAFVSAESDSQTKAQELAENAVLNELGTEEVPGTIDQVIFLGSTDSDIFEMVGPF